MVRKKIIFRTKTKTFSRHVLQTAKRENSGTTQPNRTSFPHTIKLQLVIREIHYTCDWNLDTKKET
ncbi:DUF1661 domain-containing protein [Porphyromonas gulae]|uniref:DUF1661 domain-containing protein n=1 Tax=Porphyromonas gulae TaxID=111105 RepID=UPI001269A141